jgi:spoIIIJ-associated protein
MTETKKAEEPSTSLVAKLEEEGDIAADYLEALLDITDLDGDIDIDVENDRASLAIVGGCDSGTHPFGRPDIHW